MCDSRSTSAPGYLVCRHVPPTPDEASKIVKSVMPCRGSAAPAAIPLKPAELSAPRYGSAKRAATSN